MMNKSTTQLLAMAGALALAGACSKDAKDKPVPAAARQAPANTTPTEGQPGRDKAPADKAPAKTPSMAALLADYEATRALLASDTAVGTTAHAQSIGDTASTLAAGADDPSKTQLSAVSAAAIKLADADEADIESVRLSFGELSRALIASIAVDSELSASVHVFECPMAKGFNRWLQPSADLENPYMGQKMLACGSEVPSSRD